MGTVTTPDEQARHLPVGMQLTGRAWDDSTVYRLAAAVERGPHSHS
jgi:Asp-tRNA(Asn)/Glu-tRNA(Gln) amidotransferase A subunit family amidase